MNNNILKSRINWKNISIICSIMFFIIGIFIGKNYAIDINQSQLYDIPMASPVITSTEPKILDGSSVNVQLIEGSSNVVFYDYNNSFFNLNITYNNIYPDVRFAKFTIQYIDNSGQVLTSEYSSPIHYGLNNINVPNWKIKSSINLINGKVYLQNYTGLKCISVYCI